MIGDSWCRETADADAAPSRLARSSASRDDNGLRAACGAGKMTSGIDDPLMILGKTNRLYAGFIWLFSQMKAQQR